MPIFAIKRGDALPITVQISDDAGYPLDLTGVTSVRFAMRAAGATTNKVDAVAQVYDALNGLCRYDLLTTDTDTAGIYSAEFKLTTPDGPQTYPRQGVIRVVIGTGL